MIVTFGKGLEAGNEEIKAYAWQIWVAACGSFGRCAALEQRQRSERTGELRRGEGLLGLLGDCGGLVAGELHHILACAGGPAQAEDGGGVFFVAEAGEDFGRGLAEVA